MFNKFKEDNIELWNTLIIPNLETCLSNIYDVPDVDKDQLSIYPVLHWINVEVLEGTYIF